MNTEDRKTSIKTCCIPLQACGPTDNLRENAFSSIENVFVDTMGKKSDKSVHVLSVSIIFKKAY